MFRSIGLPENVPLDLALVLSSVPDFLLAETCYAYCQASTKHRLPKYRNTFVLEEGSSLTLMCAEATADEKVNKPGTKVTADKGCVEYIIPTL